MNRIGAWSRWLALAFVIPSGIAHALPIDDVQALCGREDVHSVQVYFPETGERYIYWCEAQHFEPCPAGVCQPGEEIEIGGNDCPSGSTWDQICDRDRFPECPAGAGWDPRNNECHCDGTLVTPTCRNGRCNCYPPHPDMRGSGDHGRFVDCEEYAKAVCTDRFELEYLKKYLKKPCYTTEDCWDQWSRAEAAGPGNLTDIGACLHCVQGCSQYDPDQDGVPDPLSEADFSGKNFCTLELGSGMQQLQDYWNRQRNIQKSRQKSKQQREIEVEIKKEDRRNLDLR
jgi:hypothetical protein